MMRRVLAVIACLVCLVACTSQAPASGPVTIQIAITDTGVTPSGDSIDVSKGQTVTLSITSTHADVVHVHGFDLEIPVDASAPVTRQFTADKVGRFEIESHNPVSIIARLNVR